MHIDKWIKIRTVKLTAHNILTLFIFYFIVYPGSAAVEKTFLIKLTGTPL